MKNVRALKIAVKERELARQKAGNLLILKQELKALTKERVKIAALVEKHEIYSRFLDKVVKASKQVMRDMIRWKRPSPHRGGPVCIVEEAV